MISFFHVHSRAVARATSLAYYSESVVVSPTSGVVLPSGIQEGDLIVIFDSKYNGSGVAPVVFTPSGFTSIVSGTLLGLRSSFYYRIANGNEGGTTVVGMPGDGGGMLCVVLRPNNPITSVTVQDVASEVVHSNPLAQTINSSGGTVPLVAFAGYARDGNFAGNVISPRTFSPAEDDEITSSATIRYMKYKIYNSGSSPQSHTVDMDDEGNGNSLFSFYLEVF